MMDDNAAVVLLSGGQDSTTCLFWAKKKFKKVHALSIAYGQRHAVEIDAAGNVAAMAQVTYEHIDLNKVLTGTSPLISDNPVGQYENAESLPGGIEPTFVPARNILFLTIAANRAASIGALNLVTGVCEEDFGGYPDCRREFIDAMEEALSLGITGNSGHFKVHTPLMNLSKAESVKMALNLDGCMEAMAYSHTCYNGQVPPCGKCHACLLRARGFEKVGIEDPLLVRLEHV
jgi:7-cyano-7-deazaguanine synthase